MIKKIVIKKANSKNVYGGVYGGLKAVKKDCFIFDVINSYAFHVYRSICCCRK